MTEAHDKPKWKWKVKSVSSEIEVNIWDSVRLKSAAVFSAKMLHHYNQVREYKNLRAI